MSLTLSVLPGSWDPPPGHFEMQGAPGIGDATDLSTLGSIESPGTGLGILSSGPTPGPCSFAPCSCQSGECHPAHGFPWGLGMIYFAMDAGGGGKATTERQTCLATHYNNWRMQQQANCASVTSHGLTFGATLGTTFAACSATPATWGVAAKACAASMGAMGVAGFSFIQAQRACRANYPGAGSAC